MVGDVGGQVRRLSGRALEHPVLVVAEGGRAQPQRALGAVRQPALAEQRQRLVDRARIALAQGALEEEGVVVHAERLERGLDALEQHRDAALGEVGGVRLRGGGDRRRQVAHVVADVAVLGRLLSPRAGLDREPEAVDLRPGVVEVVLAREVVAGELEDARQRVPVRGVAPARGGQRAGRVRRDELDEDALADRRRRAPEARAGPEHPVGGGRVPGVGEKEVEEARPGDLDAREARAERVAQDAAEALGHLARRRSEDGGEQERGVRRVVAVLGLLGALERGARPRRAAVGQRTGRGLDGRAQLADGRHAPAPAREPAAKSRSRRSIVRFVPMARSTSPAVSTRSAGGCGWN